MVVAGAVAVVLFCNLSHELSACFQLDYEFVVLNHLIVIWWHRGIPSHILVGLVR